MRNLSFFFWASLLVDGVFGVDVTVSVMKGDSVTLKHQTVIPEDNKVEWKFGNKFIAKINKADGLFSTSEGDDEGFKGRLNLDHQTGSLTITNTRTNHTGLYKLQIRGKTETSKIFSVTVSDGVKSVSVKKGESVILHTGLTEIQGYDLILWKIEDDLIAEINKGSKRFLILDKDNKKFNGRLQMHHQSGSLIISDSETKDSGDYQLNMISSTHTVQRAISVTVKDSRSSGAVSGISGASVVLMVWAVTVFLLQEV